MAHTPTPWHVKKLDCIASEMEDIGIPLYVPWEEEAFAGNPEAQANAAFIVTACNAHYALLEAARLVVAGGDQCFCHAGPTSWGRHQLDLGPGPCDWCVAKKAVALAGGEGVGRC